MALYYQFYCEYCGEKWVKKITTMPGKMNCKRCDYNKIQVKRVENDDENNPFGYDDIPKKSDLPDWGD